MDNFDLRKYLAEGKLFEEQQENIVDFLKQNFDEFKQAIVHDYAEEEDITPNALVTGAYLEADGEPIESDQVAHLQDLGLDFSFDRQYVESFDEEGSSEFEIEVNGKTIYGLAYNE